MNGAIYLFQNTWGWLLVALILGLIVGWLSWSRNQRRGWLAGWAKWGAIAFVVGAVIALLKLFPGRWGLWVETALWFSASYIVGCFLGGWLRALLGMEAAVTPAKVAVAAAAAGSPSVEIFGHDTGASYPGVRPPGLAVPKGKADDLKLIDGMGPLNEKFCNEIGVHHFSQVAGWNADNARWFDYHLARPGYVGQLKWVEQAKALAQGKGVGAAAGAVGVMAAAATAGAAVRSEPLAAAHGVARADVEASARAAAAAKIEAERNEAIRLAANKAEAERAEFLRRAAAKVEADRAEAARLAAAKADAERAEAARLAAAAETARLAAAKAEADRAEAARIASAKAEAERIEAARQATLKAETERADAARLAAVKAEAERAEAARLAAAKADTERAESARLAAAKAEAERAEAARLAAAKAEAERTEAARRAAAEAAAKAEAERAEASRRAAAEAARLAAVKAEAERAEAARLAAAKAEAERAEAARIAAAKAEAERAEATRRAAAEAAAKAEAERAEAAVRAAAEAARLKAEAEHAEAARIAAAKAEADRAEAARRAAAEAAAKAEAERAAATAHPGARPAALALMGADKGDDLKWIRGIGPKNEKICNELGVYRFRQIADWTPENATWVGHHVKFPGRIEREQWIPQARLLAAGLDTDHSIAVKSGRIHMDDSADAPLSEADAAAFQKGLPQMSPKVEGEDKHGGTRPVGLLGPRGGKPDNLKLISGIGKQNEARLHGLGIWHFDQIAAWTVDNIKWAGSYLAFPGRIDRELWVSQAKDLAAGRQTEFARRAAAGLVKTSVDDGTLGQGNVEVVPPKT